MTLTLKEVVEGWFAHYDRDETGKTVPQKFWEEIEKFPIAIMVQDEEEDGEIRCEKKLRINRYKRQKNRSDFAQDGEIALESFIDESMGRYIFTKPEELLGVNIDIDFLEGLLPTYVMGIVNGGWYSWNRERQEVFNPPKWKLHVLKVDDDKTGLVYEHVKTVGNEAEAIDFVRQNNDTDKPRYKDLPVRSCCLSATTLEKLYIISHRGNTLGGLYRDIRMSCG